MIYVIVFWPDMAGTVSVQRITVTLFLFFLFLQNFDKLLYSQESDASLILVMPDIEDFEFAKENLARESIISLIEAQSKSETEILLPQMTMLHKNLELIPFLKKFNIQTLFNETQEFRIEKTDSKINDTVYRPMHVRSIRENIYFSTSFVAVNSVSSVISKLGESVLIAIVKNSDQMKSGWR